MTDENENHEIRMRAGQATMAGLDALDDESFEHFERIGEAIGGLVEHLEELGLTPLNITNWVVSGAVGIMFSWNEDRREGEGRET